MRGLKPAIDIKKPLQELQDSNLLSNHFIYNPGSDQELEARFSRSKKFYHNITYKFTDNPVELEQYYRIRSRMYDEFYGVGEVANISDEFDDTGKVLTVKNGVTVIGGARINYFNSKNGLPLNYYGLNINKIAKDIGLSHFKFGEYSKFVLMPEYRHFSVVRKMVVELTTVVERSGVSGIFFVCTPEHMDIYRKSLQALGRDAYVFNNSEFIAYSKINALVGFIDFTESQSFIKKLTAVKKVMFFEGKEKAVAV